MGRPDEWIDSFLQGRVCFDTTVPRHFIAAGLGAYLTPFLGRACWPPAVEAELRRAQFPGASTLIGGQFAEVLPLTEEWDEEAEDLRLESLTRAERQRNLTKNRGEAECVILCEHEKMPLVIHDELGREWARRRHVEVFTAIDMLCVSVRRGLAKPAAAWRAYGQICSGRDPMIPLAPYPPGAPGHTPFMRRAEPLYSLFEAERDTRAP
jgi:hypothetical protein